MKQSLERFLTCLILCTAFCSTMWAQSLQEKIKNRQQLTNLATVYFDVPDAVGKDINSVLFKDRVNNIAPYHQTTIQVVENGCQDGTGRSLGNFTESGLEIKVRGNSTADYDKKPYRLRFYKDEKDAAGNVTASHKHDMLGYGYEKRNWTILANHKDGTLMQNAITYYIGKAVGMPFCPGYKFVDLVINGEYRGNYMLSDHVELGKNRIDINEDTGWFVESTRNDMVEEPYFNDASLYVLIKSPESKDEAVTAKIKQMIRKYFVNNNNSLFGINTAGCDDKTFCDPFIGWRSVFDEESLVNFYVGLQLTGDSDGMMQVKMYREENGKMQFGPLWDKDLAFGVQDDGKTLAEGNSLDFGAPTFNNYIKKIMKTDPVFVKKVHDKLHEVIDNGYVNKIIAEIDKIEPTLLQSKALEYENCEDERAVSVSAYPEAVENLRKYIRNHTKWFVDFMDERYESMGGDNIKIPVVGEMPNTNEMKLSEWKTFPINSTLFKPNATSAKITITGASTIKIYNTNTLVSGNVADSYLVPNGDFGYSGSNQAGVTYAVSGQLLDDARNGNLYVYVGGGSDIKLIVENTVPATPPTPTRGQLTNLPTIYLDATTINGEWQEAAVEVFDSENKLYQGATWKKEGLSKKGNINVSVQYQGSGAAGSKNSYRLKFNDKINLLTADGLYKQWVLLANDDDPSMLNNALAKELGDAIGMPWTPGYQFVDLYVNNTYMGTYQLTDRVKAEEGRSLVAGGNKDLDWQVRFNDDTELAEDGTKDYISGSGVNTIYRNPDPKDITADALATLKTEMSAYFNGLFAETSTGKFENFAANVDQEQLVNWYIAQEILGVYKGFSSIEAYRSVTATDQKLHFGPLWDNEKAFGNTGSAPSITDAMSDLNTEGSHDGLMIEYAAFPKMKAIFQYLWTQEWFSTAVLAKWETLYSGNINEGLAQKLRNYAASRYSTISQLSQPKNLEVWPNSLEYNSSTHAKYADFIDAYKAIGTYINQRFPYLDKKFKEMAVEACEHVVDRYQDNHDGTHTPICKKCNSLIVAETAIHNYKAENGHPLCSLCYTTENNAAIEGTPTNGDKVYRIVESENSANIKYVTAMCGFAPADNSIYISNEEISEESNLTNVAWPRTADDEYNANAIVLKDKAYPYDTNAKSMHAKSASYSRNMSSTWGTLCLPFKIASCDDYTLYSITSTNLNDDGTGTLVFDEINSAKGLMPVVFRKNTDATTVTFRGVPQDKAGADYDLVTVKKSKKFTNVDAIASTSIAGSGTWDLYGNVKKDNTAKIATYPNIYYISQNKFWHATEDVKVATFRAVFIFTPEPGAENAAKSMSIAIGDNDATGIHNKVIDKNLAIFTGTGEVTLQSNYNARVYIYNVNGTKVANANLKKDAQQHISLPKGVYIINGTKVVVK
ncbi:MAG: CotH kinase family protein [Bacteroidaceae bacterium]|nr:CotH kinase family protein [Bacteroidaceae bacterium]